MHYCVLVITNDDPDVLLAPYDEALDGPDRVCTTHVELLEHMDRLKESNPSIKELQDEPMKAAEYWYSQFTKDYIKDGEVWTHSNPNGKWDWYQYGGRFYDALDEHYEWDHRDEDGYGYSDNDYYEVSKIKESFSPAAVITPDGEWHEPGEGYWWFGIDASEDEVNEYHHTVYEKYIKPYQGYKCYVVDCHL